jgi:perosamine synthetase
MIPIFKPWITDLEKSYVKDAMESGWVSSIGPYIERFESLFATRIGVKHAVATNTGTAACHLALASLNFRPGDEIIVPATTFVATANAVKYCNCDVVVADIDPDTWNMDVRLIEPLTGPRTVAVFAVHLYGNLCDMDTLKKACERNSLILVEDACEALGGSFNGKQAGSIGKTSAFSFYGNKTITTGEGGMFATDDDELYERAKMFKGQGQTDRYYHPIIGHNYRMTNIQAAIGLAQLERLDEIQVEKKRVFNEYEKMLYFGCQTGKIKWSKRTENAIHSCWSVTVCVPDPARTMFKLQEEGMETRRVFYPISSLPPYRGVKGSDSCKESESLYSKGISLPSYAELSNDEIAKVCEAVLRTL